MAPETLTPTQPKETLGQIQHNVGPPPLARFDTIPPVAQAVEPSSMPPI